MVFLLDRSELPPPRYPPSHRRTPVNIKRGNITAAPGALCAGALCALLRHNAAACALCARQGHYGPAHNARQCVGQRSAHYAPAHYARAAPIRRLLAHYVFYFPIMRLGIMCGARSITRTRIMRLRIMCCVQAQCAMAPAHGACARRIMRRRIMRASTLRHARALCAGELYRSFAHNAAAEHIMRLGNGRAAGSSPTKRHFFFFFFPFFFLGYI